MTTAKTTAANAAAKAHAAAVAKAQKAQAAAAKAAALRQLQPQPQTLGMTPGLVSPYDGSVPTGGFTGGYPLEAGVQPGSLGALNSGRPQVNATNQSALAPNGDVNQQVTNTNTYENKYYSIVTAPQPGLFGSYGNGIGGLGNRQQHLRRSSHRRDVRPARDRHRWLVQAPVPRVLGIRHARCMRHWQRGLVPAPPEAASRTQRRRSRCTPPVRRQECRLGTPSSRTRRPGLRDRAVVLFARAHPPWTPSGSGEVEVVADLGRLDLPLVLGARARRCRTGGRPRSSSAGTRSGRSSCPGRW